MHLKYIFLSFLSCLLSVLSAQFENNKITSDDYFDHESKRVVLIRQKMNWIQAVEFAQSYGANLLQIEDPLKQLKIDSFIVTLQGKSFDYDATRIIEENLSAAWIGATDLVLEGNWQWNGDGTNTGNIFWIGDFEDGVAYGFHNWGGKLAGVLIKPDDDNDTKNAAAISLTGFLLGSRGEWLDANNDEELYFFIEKECHADTIRLNLDLCDGELYIVDSNTIDSPGEYIFSYINNRLCDSVVILNVTYHPQYFDTLHLTSCDGDFYTFGDFTFNSPGEYVVKYKSINNCDSTIIINFEWFPLIKDTIIRYICEGDSIWWSGNRLSTTGIYEEIYFDDNQCKAFKILDLRVGDFALYYEDKDLCFGDSLFFSDTYLSKSGMYYDTINIREKCDSITVLRLRVKEDIRDTIVAYYCSGSYFIFNGDTLTTPGYYSITLQSIDGCDSTVVLQLNEVFTSINNIYREICFGDSIVIGENYFYSSGNYELLFANRYGCDSIVILNLHVHPENFDDQYLKICQADQYVFGGQIITQSGLYFHTFTGANGCDSLVSLTVEFVEENELIQNLFDTICSNSFYEFNGDTLVESGTYEAAFPIGLDCDSIVRLHLTVLPADIEIFRHTICEGESFSFEGEALNLTGTYAYTYQKENGCDSVRLLVLEVLPVFLDTIVVPLCGVEYYIVNGDTLTVSGQYPYYYSTNSGCDSTVVYQLNFFNRLYTEEYVDICEGETYTFGINELTETGVYRGLYVLGPNCDSLITLNLTVHPKYSDTIKASICSGYSIEFGEQTFYDSGVYTYSSQSIAGCDSIVVLELSVHPSYDSLTKVVVCDGNNYYFEGQEFSIPGTYQFNYQSIMGCDSIIKLDLTFVDRSETNIEVTICEGETYSIGDSIYSLPGSYSYLFRRQEQCDSIVNLQLHVNPIIRRIVPVEICQGDTVEYEGYTLSSAGSYPFVYQSSVGCDSIIEILITLRPIYADTLKASICGGESFVFEGVLFENTGIYPFVYQTPEGCDSIRVLDLTVHKVNTIAILEKICRGEEYVLGDTIINTGGVYRRTLKNRFGCDSIVFLNLLITDLDPVIITDGNLLSVGNYAEVSWHNCNDNVINNDVLAGGNQFLITEEGYYAAVVSDGICVDTSDCVFAMISGTDETNINPSIRIMPNPTVGKIAIEVEAGKWYLLDIIDNLGKSIRQITMPSNPYFVIDLNEIDSGIYYLKFSGSAGIAVLPLVVTK